MRQSEINNKNNDSNFYFNQDIETRNNFKTYPKIKVNYGKSNKPIYSNDFWENSKVNARDLEDLNGLVQTLDFSELKKLAKENPELVSHYILANHNGYDLSDQKDCELYFEETNSEISFNDLKPYSTY